MAESVISRKEYSRIRSVDLTPSQIPANTYIVINNLELKNVAIVGYSLYGVTSSNVSVTQLYSDNSGLTMVIKNNSSYAVTPTNIFVRILE